MRRKNGDGLLDGGNMACRIYSVVRRKEAQAQAPEGALRYLCRVRKHGKLSHRGAGKAEMNSDLPGSAGHS